jgi:hypothetical protein
MSASAGSTSGATPDIAASGDVRADGIHRASVRGGGSGKRSTGETITPTYGLTGTAGTSRATSK